MIAPDFAPLDDVGAVLCGDGVVSVHIVRGPLGDDRSIHLATRSAVDMAYRILDVADEGRSSLAPLVAFAAAAFSGAFVGALLTILYIGVFRS